MTDTAKTHRVAVYGSLRKGEYNYRDDMGEMVAKGIIRGALLFSLGAFPCIVKSESPDDTVVVEVYDLPEKVFGPIDRMELGAGYHREQVTVTETTAGNELIAEAYFYPSKQDWFGKQIKSGDWTLRANG